MDRSLNGIYRASREAWLNSNFLLHPPPPGHHGATALSVPGHPHCRRFTIVQRHIPLGRTPPDEGSARRRDLYLTTHNTHKRQTSMASAGFEPTIPASERPQTHVLDRAGTGIDKPYLYRAKIQVPAVNKARTFVMGPKTWISVTVPMLLGINKTVSVRIT